MACSDFWILVYLAALTAAEANRPVIYASRIDGGLLG